MKKDKLPQKICLVYAKNLLSGEKNGKKIGKTLNTAQKDVKEIKLKKFRN